MKNILAVDNDSIILRFLEEVLTNEGYTVKTASDGLDALSVVNGFVPDLFIVDLVMPNIDGEKLAMLLRSKKEYKKTPIVILSGIAPERRDSRITEYADCMIAKMPRKQLEKHLLRVIGDIQRGNYLQYKHTIVGYDEIHERVVTKELLYCNKHFEVLLANISDGYVELSGNYTIVYANKAALEIIGTTMENFLGGCFLDFFEEEARNTVSSFFNTVTDNFAALGNENPIAVNNRHVVLEVSPLQIAAYKSMLVVVKDITLQKHIEEQLKNTLKEINHRVKNNLVNITALANIELEAEKKTKRESIEDLISRIGSIEVMHELLYSGESFSEINIKTYITNFVEKVDIFYHKEDTTAAFNLDIEPLRFTTKLTTTIGIILSEFITNSFKYANDVGRVTISISLRGAGNEYALVYSDSGTGLAGINSIDDLNTGTGILLIKELVAGLHGTFALDTAVTTTFSIRFPKD